MTSQPATFAPAPTQTGSSFDWPLAYEAEQWLRRHIAAFLARNREAARLADRMRTETGTDFYEWVDHLMVAPGDEAELRALGLTEEKTEAPAGVTVFAKAGIEAQRLPAPACMSWSRILPAETICTGNGSTFGDISQAR